MDISQFMSSPTSNTNHKCCPKWPKCFGIHKLSECCQDSLDLKGVPCMPNVFWLSLMYRDKCRYIAKSDLCSIGPQRVIIRAISYNLWPVKKPVQENMGWKTEVPNRFRHFLESDLIQPIQSKLIQKYWSQIYISRALCILSVLSQLCHQSWRLETWTILSELENRYYKAQVISLQCSQRMQLESWKEVSFAVLEKLVWRRLSIWIFRNTLPYPTVSTRRKIARVIYIEAAPLVVSGHTARPAAVGGVE